jgi:hypothetical protein
VTKKNGRLKMRDRAIMLLKTNVEKMSVYGLAIMLMKTDELNASSHYVDEKKDGY